MAAFELIKGGVSPSNVTAIKNHLDSLSEYLTADVSNYAKGRRRFWINQEWDLKNKRLSPAPVQDERLWAYISRKFVGADLALAAYGPVGIGLHRDDSYADFEACTINLGELETWIYEESYPLMDRWSPPDQQIDPPVVHRLNMEPGDIIRFNCKNRHSAVNPAADRWSINIWRLKNRQGRR